MGENLFGKFPGNIMRLENKLSLKELQPNSKDNGNSRQAKQNARSRLKQKWGKEMRKNPTKAENLMKDFLKNNFPQHKFKMHKIIRGFIPDFWCSKLNLIIEVDGEIHNQQKDYDKNRDAILKSLGLRIVRFTNWEIENENRDYILRRLDLT